jgi:hypothetical protein
MDARRLAVLVLVLAAAAAAGPASAQEPPARFRTIDVVIDAGTGPLAAWQVAIRAAGDGQLVGIEGGDAPAYREPPYYDPRALGRGVVVLAGFSTERDGLRTGRQRVARLHVREGAGAAEWQIEVTAAADSQGRPIGARGTLVPRGD